MNSDTPPAGWGVSVAWLRGREQGRHPRSVPLRSGHGCDRVGRSLLSGWADEAEARRATAPTSNRPRLRWRPEHHSGREWWRLHRRAHRERQRAALRIARGRAGRLLAYGGADGGTDLKAADEITSGNGRIIRGEDPSMHAPGRWRIADVRRALIDDIGSSQRGSRWIASVFRGFARRSSTLVAHRVREPGGHEEGVRIS